MCLRLLTACRVFRLSLTRSLSVLLTNNTSQPIGAQEPPVNGPTLEQASQKEEELFNPNFLPSIDLSSKSSTDYECSKHPPALLCCYPGRQTSSSIDNLTLTRTQKQEAWLFLFAVVLAAVLLFTAVFYVSTGAKLCMIIEKWRVHVGFLIHNTI